MNIILYDKVVRYWIVVSRITFQSLLFKTVHTFDIQIVISNLKSTDTNSQAVDSETDTEQVV